MTLSQVRVPFGCISFSLNVVNIFVSIVERVKEFIISKPMSFVILLYTDSDNILYHVKVSITFERLKFKEDLF